jgi:hypothetical protein
MGESATAHQDFELAVERLLIEAHGLSAVPSKARYAIAWGHRAASVD